MKALTDPGPWKFPLLTLIAALILLRGRRGAIALVALVLTIAMSDQLSSRVLKPIVRRPRPSVELSDTRPLFGVRGTYSLPSVHATNFFAAAPLLGTVFPQGAAAFYGLAGLVSLSRVYVGDHYPSDVVAGGILGLLIGFLGRKAYFRAERTILRRPRGAHPEPRSVPGEAAPSGGP
ncbi:MAG: phosphatase PAP2 family protein [Candidatus Latescibacteria bacterium]|nr:phosphatase PAP2 family protein [Candidatus Latescibacterota bacterium]